jgi:selenocysteine lyase/cysteine desulfurase
MATHPEFPLEIIHLNHAGVGPWPQRAAAAVERFARENARLGSRRYERWLAVEHRLRERLARLIGAAAPEDVALVKNTSEALSIVAHGLDWRPGDEVVLARQEFPSNRIVWESLDAPFGVRVRAVDLADGPSPEDALLAAFGPRTRLLAVSAVQYADGLRMDLGRLGAACRDRGVVFCVDAIQALGVVPFDARAVGADVVAADGHKWMLGPEGLGVLWCRPELRERLRLHQYGWHMVAHAGDFDRTDWTPARDARRFEPGSPNLLGAHALEASLSLIEETGIEQVHAAVARRVARLAAALRTLGLEIVTPAEAARRAGILTFRPREGDPDALHQSLVRSGIICARRAGGVRFSPHFHTPMEHIDEAVAQVQRWMAGLRP